MGVLVWCRKWLPRGDCVYMQKKRRKRLFLRGLKYLVAKISK
ncbi:hypothetical protein N39L_09960 [Limnospira platensis NIES-39]|nr:hypothetical protein N39L_09960 [Arthrospira platensis NIES-39]